MVCYNHTTLNFTQNLEIIVMKVYSFFEILKYFCGDEICNLVDAEKFLKNIIVLENYISEDTYCLMTHTREKTNDQRSRYVNRIIQRRGKNTTDSSKPWKQFLSKINTFFNETETSDINIYFDNMRQKIAEQFCIENITERNQKIDKFITIFLNLSPQNIFMNPECSDFSRKLIEYLYRQDRFQEYIMWTIFLSLYPIDVDKEDMDSLIRYWKISSKLKDAFNNISNSNKDLHCVTSSNGLHSLSLEGMNLFLESILDEDLGITVDIINQHIDARISVINDDELGIETDILQENEQFRAALNDAQNILKKNKSYYVCLKLLFFLPMYRIRTQELLQVPGISRSMIQSMRQNKIILSNGGDIILDYSYQVVFDYMKNISKNFTQLGKFEEFSFFSSDYLIGQWKNLLNTLLIDESKRDILSDEEKKSLLSSIHFGQGEAAIKKIYEQSILRREKT